MKVKAMLKIMLNVTLQIGLGIGKVVFAALNKVEWTLIFLISICFFVEIPLMNSV